MKSKVCLTSLIILIFLGADNAAAQVHVDITDEVGATGMIIEDFVSGPVLDNFNDGGNSNLWEGKTGCFTDAAENGSCIFSNDSASPKEGAYCLKLDYDVIIKDSYAGYFNKLQAEDLNGYTSISFWVRGKTGGEFFKIELKNNKADDNRNHAAVYITDYLDGGVTAGWQQVTIPFHNFANINDWASAKELVITFENSQSADNGSPVQGTVYIDNISFGSEAINVVRIDHYGDKLGISSLGGNMGNMPNDYPTKPYSKYSFSTTQYRDFRNGLLSEYHVDPGWAGIYIIFGGGDDGWTPIPHDFSGYNYLTLYIKAQATLKNPKVLKVELEDSFGKRSHRISGITDSWKFFKIPLSDFSGLNKDTIKQMNLVYEDWQIANYAGNKIGGLLIDKLQFEK